MSLIARWRFEPGNLWVDSSGNSNTLTPAAAGAAPTSDTSWRVEGQGSVKFVQASAQRASIAEADQSAGFPCLSTDGTPVTTFTICGWVKKGTLSAAAGILNKWTSTDAEKCFQLWISHVTGRMAFNLHDATNISYGEHQTALAENGVYFFGAGYNNTSESRFLYIRDIYANTVGSDIVGLARSAGWNGLNVSSVVFYVGASNADSNQLNGWLDDIRIYSGDYLTAAQVTQICRQSSGLAGRRLMMGG